MPRGDQYVQNDQGRAHRVWRRPRDSPQLADQAPRGQRCTEADLTVSERARLKELEREVQELRAETAFLKKATAYFAREQR